ncbi:hypothetical protein J8L70_13400 [Pseudoalteromonas sp. MMG010]|uniref:hypothetical protein n=1 Tax=Pseudoalteromonas sp. MMG010 TaxID=2822685 RepID=UPI001B39D245|nr:hypothetical protein [Pseudoalteromonas sp. MMG010]MBQ4834243.1 hypothetical protein [Pseudoalteromonas sp. MMG010]
MNISNTRLPTMPNSNEGGEVLSAALSKKQLQADGATALQLVDSAAQATAAQTPAKSATASLGNNIDVYV